MMSFGTFSRTLAPQKDTFSSRSRVALVKEV
jgi:hypothetical protein